MPFGRRRNRIDRSLRERGVPRSPAQGPRGARDQRPLRRGRRPGRRRRAHRPRRHPAARAAGHGPAGRAVPAAEGHRRHPARGQLPAAGVRVRRAARRRHLGRRPGRARISRPARVARSARWRAPSAPSWPARSWPRRRPARCDRAAAAGPPGRPLPRRRRPRWFLRGLITGPAAEDAEAAQPLEAAFRGIVVARGTEPMPVREQLPLRLPPQAAAHLARQQAAGQPAPGQRAPGQPAAGQPRPVPPPTPEWAASSPGSTGTGRGPTGSSS